ncbi:MAG TPA: hypothetical protein VFD66_13295 [Verrucomicrobiae bacterium]|nr:hypothetical protein [Verrucomicrobiae bacterium]
MLFNSFAFFLFFPLVTVCYFLLPHRCRWGLLLGASCLFYMYFIPKYILILAFTIVVDYVAGLLIEPAEGSRRRLYLLLSIGANVGVLALFKYFNFVSDNLRLLAGLIQELKGRGIAVVLVTLPVSRYYADGMDRARSEPGMAAIAANGSR